MATQRGICPVCDREYGVLNEGVMRVHRAAGHELFRPNCAGVGQAPKRVLPDAGSDMLAAFAAAEQRGYQRAIADLRNLAAAHLKVAPDGPSFDAYDIAADGLEALATQPTDTTTEKP